MRVYEPLDHPALSISYGGHIDVESVDAYSELLAAANIVRDLRRMNDVLTWQTCDVRASPADILALYCGDALSLSRKGPGQQFRAGAATEDEEIINFRLLLNTHMYCSPS